MHNLIVEKWLNQDLLSVQWWGIVAIIIFSYVLAFSLLDKRRFTQILLFGSLMAVSITTYDLVGANLGLWAYKVRLLPLIPGVFLYDYTVIPLYLCLFINTALTGRCSSFGMRFYPALLA